MPEKYMPDALRVVIPVGGEAKRLKPLTAEVSKACVRLLNRPMIEIALACLAKQGVRNFIFGVKGYINYKSLHDYFKEGLGFSLRYGISPRVHIKYQPNEEDFGSADSLRINLEYYDIADPVFGVQGDNIFDIDLQDLLNFHQSRRAFMSIVLRTVKDVEGYGIADIDKDMRISRFAEKPKREDAPSNLANTGLYLFSPKIRKVFYEKKVMKMLSENRRLDFGYDLIPYLIEAGYPVYGYSLKGSWYDVGTPERYLYAMREILYGSLSGLSEFGEKISEGVWVQGESIESIRRRNEIVRKLRKGEVHFEGKVLIGRHCQIGKGVAIIDSCIDNFTQIGDNTVIEGSAVMDRAKIGEGTEVRNSIIGRHSTVNSSLENPTKIASVSVIGDDVTINVGCNIIATKVYPHAKLSSGEHIKKVIQ